MQLWVNLPRNLKMTPPRYQDIGADKVVLLSSDDGGALVRLIAGDLDGHEGPGVDLDADHLRARHGQPRLAAAAAVEPGLQRPGLRAHRRRQGGHRRHADPRGPDGRLRPRRRRLRVEADATQDSRSPNLDVLVLGGKPIREPVFFHGPFVMNTREEIFEAIEDYHAGRLGQIPASYLA